MTDINNLGTFSSIDAVWAKYPEGGKEGDYLTIGKVKFRWNKYDCIWENAEVVTQSTARSNETIDGDLTVNNNLTVGGTITTQDQKVKGNLQVSGVLKAANVKQPNCGLFTTLASLKAAYPNPIVGMWATVGSTVPAEVYVCRTAGTWTDTGETGGIDTMDYDKIAQIDTNKTDIATLKSRLDTLVGTSASEAIDNFNEILAFLSGVKDSDTLTALLTDLNDKISNLTDATAGCLQFVIFHGFVDNVDVAQVGITNANQFYYDVTNKRFVAKSATQLDNNYYRAFTPNNFIDEDENILTNRIFVNVTTGDCYRYYGDTLVALGIEKSTFDALNDTIAGLQAGCLQFVIFHGFVGNVDVAQVGITNAKRFYYDVTNKYFVATRGLQLDNNYYRAFTPNNFIDEDQNILTNRIFVNAVTDYCYRYNGDTLVALGIEKSTFDALNDTIAQWQEHGLPASMIPDDFDEVIHVSKWVTQENKPTPQVIKDGLYMYDATKSKLYVSVRKEAENSAFVVSWSEITPSKEKLYIDDTNLVPYIWNGTGMDAIAPKNTPASIFNATTEVPISGYYVLCDPDNTGISAVHAAWNAGKAVSGLIISFELSAGIWKTYQYVGKTVTETNWLDTDNWKDFGSLAAGSETYIVIDQLCGSATGGFYTLASAVDALMAYQTKTGVTYAKKGLIISYKTAQNEMETKQFQGEVSDFNQVGLWKNFGGGGEVETKDDPEKDGKDAFSTGGAYSKLPTDLKVDTETEGVVKLSMVNAAGETVGNEQQFSVGTGGGGGTSGTIVSASFKNSSMYGKAGGSFEVLASVRSVTTSGSEELLNNIEKAELYDRDSNTLLETFTENKPSSDSITTYDYSFDLSSYMTQAGTKRFKFIFYDDSGNTGSRNISLTAVDVTVSSVQTLNYTASTALEVNGGSKSIPLFKFANNANQIKAITEIYLNGSWQTLNEQVIKDTYSVALTINPQNTLGTQLAHGTYALRIHGVDVTSGVVGNYLHTSLFVIGSASTPLIATRWLSDDETAVVKLYESIKLDYAVYDPNTTSALAQVMLDGEEAQSHVAYRSSTYTYTHQVTGVAYDGSKTLSVNVKSGAGISQTSDFKVNGTVIDALLKTGAIYSFDFSNRSNDDEDKSIKSGSYEISVVGSNYSTTGFKTFLGEKCLRVAEDVKASLNHYPFQSTDIEKNGLGLQFAFASKNLPDDTAMLMSCYDESTGAGFYVTGKAVGIYVANSTTNKREERFYKQGEKTTVAVVAEPAAEGLGITRSGTTYYFLKLYLNGEEVAAIGYTAGSSNLIQKKNITFDGTKGDFYLYYMLAWNDYFQFDQAFQNYLVKLTSTDDMVEEYTFENVMAAQQITEYGSTSLKSRPQAATLYAKGMAYFVECPYNGSNIESLDDTTSTDTNMYVTLYYFNPARPYTNFVAYDVRRRNQGTTSAKRPVKNPRYYLAAKNGSTYDKKSKTGGTTMQLLSPDESTEAGRIAIALAKCNKMQLFDDSIPIDTITVKLDYSDSSNANDCGVCDQMNATFRALGGMYITPPQRAFDGTWSGSYKDDEGNKVAINLTGLKMNHSTANHPAAMFRSTESTGTSPYFHAKGNWKEDKKEQVALGFKDTPGYNKGCLNYGDFTEYYGNEGETLEQTKARFLQEASLSTSTVYVLTEYCGRSYKVMKYVENSWAEQEGSMKMVDGKWVITGSVVNPTDGFELLQYEGMDWFKGVSSVSDMMSPVTTYSKWVQQLVDKGSISIESAPAWTQYFECLLDDDNLAIAYATGKKVPYNLYEWLLFCDACDPDGSDLEAAKTKWHGELYKYACPESVMAYDVFTDYDAATDQRAKNMQPMWFLEDGASVVNGVYFDSTTIGCHAIRMYLNKVYDCDTCNGKDNDGGQTVDAETDPNKMSDETFTNPYAGYGSTLFRMIYNQQQVLNPSSTDKTAELNLQSVASAMRSCTATVSGVTLHPFSPEGAEFFFLTQRIKRWQKKLSSYDGERKYIQFTGTSDAIYFYALQGLGLTSLPAFLERRWRYRDGFFGTGNFFSGVLSGRVNAPSGARIHIKAAKSGYFGIGNDSSGSITEKVYLEAGEEHYFTTFSHEEGALLYIYQADRMSMIDLSELTISNTFDFSIMSLVEELHIGSSSYSQRTIGSYTVLTSANLGELPFLKTLHVENTGITTIGCESCPRLEGIYAYGSQLQRIDLADGAKITTLQLPATYNYLRLRYLPLLTIDGIGMENQNNISTLIVEQCTKISAWELLMKFAGNSGTNLKVVRATPVNVKGTGAELDTLEALNLTGLDATLTLQEKPAICGKYRCTSYKEESVIEAWQDAFGSDLKVNNALYSQYTMSDAETDPKNITNEDNQTGYKYNNDYVASGYIKSIRRHAVPVQGTPNSDGSAMTMQLLKASDNSKYANGSDYDLTDSIGACYDTFARFPHFWYKGINDYKNQEKHILLSYGKTQPEDSWTEKKQGTLAELLYKSGVAISINTVVVGEAFTDSMMPSVASCSVYRIDVEGMKQVRYYGLNNASYGAVFVDADGNTIQTAVMAVAGSTASPIDFANGDYLFRDVPTDAKYLYFSCMSTVDQTNVCFAVDSDDIEAIEPGWVEHKSELIGMYGFAVDSLVRARSLSSMKTKTGTGTSTTSSEWNYDSDGNPTTVPTSAMNYTYQDMLNLCRSRGKGYHSIGYDQSKILAILSLCWSGNRDDQSVYGFGTSSQYTTGDKNKVGKDTKYNLHTGTNKVWNVEGAIACNWEIMDFIGVNISSFKAWKAAYRAQTGTVNGVAHIYDPHTDEERTVPYCTNSGYDIARIRLGKYCDVLASSTNSDNSKWVTGFCAGSYYNASAGRCVGRAVSSANAFGGLVYANANYASSNSNASNGARLAFSGELTNDDEIDNMIEQYPDEYKDA